MPVFTTDFISPNSGKYYLKAGKVYSVWLPTYNLSDLPSPGDQGSVSGYSAGNLEIKYRDSPKPEYVDIEIGMVHHFDGSDIEYLSGVPNGTMFYIVRGDRAYMAYPRLSAVPVYDNFVGEVAASTALTKRTALTVPFGQRVKMSYMLSVSGAPGTVGDLYYIGIVTSGGKLYPRCVQGSVSGEVEFSDMTAQTVWIEYQNLDTVAHAMNGSFQVSVIQ